LPGVHAGATDPAYRVPMVIRTLKKQQYVVDAAIAVAYYVLAAQYFGGYNVYFANVTGDNAYIIIIGGYALSLALRRVSPGIALGVAWVISILQMWFVVNPSVYNVATLIVVYTASAYGGRIVRSMALASVGLGALVAAVFLTVQGAALGVSESIFGFSTLPATILQFVLLFFAMLFVLGVPWLLGLLVRWMTRNRESREAKEAAEQIVIVEQERNRIARDMHDVVAHSLAVVIAQSDGARYVRRTDPEAVDEALLAISTTARDALADVRLLLGQLRHSQGDGPQPVLADLDRLLDQFRASGLTVVFEQNGQPRPLGTAHELSVYRIVQEAITNALRHGDHARDVTVRFDWLPETLDISITNGIDVPATTAELHIGHGLAGMTERAALVGGLLQAAPAGSQFVVSASLPTNVPTA
jgi:signal transduction histidine kinase